MNTVDCGSDSGDGDDGSDSDYNQLQFRMNVREQDPDPIIPTTDSLPPPANSANLPDGLPTLRPRAAWMIDEGDRRTDAEADADWHVATHSLLGSSSIVSPAHPLPSASRHLVEISLWMMIGQKQSAGNRNFFFL
jgi:hypothetical protein